MNKNALNIAVAFSLLNTALVLLLADNMVTLYTFSDNGAASYINIALLLICVGYSFWLGLIAFAGRRLDWFCLAFVFQVYMAREADLHRSFSDQSLTNWSTYLRPDTPALLKLSAVLVLALLFMSMSYLLARYLPNVMRAVKKLRPWAVSFVIWFICLFSGQIIDRTYDRSMSWRYVAVEETLEVCAAVFALLALIQFTLHYRDKYKDYFS